MLKHLHIEHYAIIDALDIDLFQGMTVLTGETGAGKSIIVDALSLLLGDRASKEMIANNSDTAYVVGTFLLRDDAIKKILKHHEIDADDEMIIERTISKENRNIVKINHQVASIKILKELAIHLADIHSQFDTSRLINPENYLALVDHYRKSRMDAYLLNYQEAYDIYKEELNAYKKVLKEKDDTLKKLDLYQYQLKELTELNLTANEDEMLEEQIRLLENMDKIHSVLEMFHHRLEAQNTTETLYELKQSLASIGHTSKEFSALADRLSNIYYELDDIDTQVTHQLETLDYNQATYEGMLLRLTEIERFKSKYHMTVTELLEHLAYLQKQVDTVENYDDVIQMHVESLDKAYQHVLKEGLQLRAFRKDIAKKITKEIKETLEDLVIKDCAFEIRFADHMPKGIEDISSFSTLGIDEVDFYISTNKGQPLKQLSKTASGGEMSRIMLAFKSIFVRSNQISTIIFDEIDTGISGYVAKQIANKIKEISDICQVISITHIPQVVATGTHHIAVRKQVINHQTKMHVGYLDYEARVEEIAKMISADEVTNAAIESAKELLM